MKRTWSRKWVPVAFMGYVLEHLAICPMAGGRIQLIHIPSGSVLIDGRNWTVEEARVCAQKLVPIIPNEGTIGKAPPVEKKVADRIRRLAKKYRAVPYAEMTQ